MDIWGTIFCSPEHLSDRDKSCLPLQGFKIIHPVTPVCQVLLETILH